MTDPVAEALTATQVLALADADMSDDPLRLRLLAVLNRAHDAGLVFGGRADIVDPTGWTKSTFPAVASLLADAAREYAITSAETRP
jgi:hypothetical protein